jgi:hypothetical protein
VKENQHRGPGAVSSHHLLHRLLLFPAHSEFEYISQERVISWLNSKSQGVTVVEPVEPDKELDGEQRRRLQSHRPEEVPGLPQEAIEAVAVVQRSRRRAVRIDLMLS